MQFFSDDVSVSGEKKLLSLKSLGLFLACLLWWSLPVQADKNDNPPSILIFICDDLGIDRFALYGDHGSSHAPTPNFDALAEDGVLFLNAYADPVCSPSRAKFQTGQYSFRNGIGHAVGKEGNTNYELQEHHITLAEALKQGTGGQYATGMIGKWHLSLPGNHSHPNSKGWDHYAGVLGNIDDHNRFEKTTNGEAKDHEAYSVTDQINDAVAWIASLEEDQPYLCVVAFSAPHAPFQAPPDHLHTNDDVYTDPSDENFYKATIEAIDTELGRCLEELNGIGRLKNTLVAFTSDNGPPKPVAPEDKKEKAKKTVYEPGITVPLVICGDMIPDIAKGQTCEALISMTDFMATLAEITCFDLEEEFPETVFDSISFLDYLSDPEAESKRKFVYAERFTHNHEHAGIPTALDGSLENIGFQGPGDTRMFVRSENGPMREGDSLVVTIRNAPANRLGYLIYGAEPKVRRIEGTNAIVVPSLDIITKVTTNSRGEANLRFEPPLSEPGTIFYMQFVIDDPFSVLGCSEAYQGKVNPNVNRKAILCETVDGQVYKWHYRPTNVGDGWPTEQLFNLSVDPCETIDLLDGDLSDEEETSYQMLKREMFKLWKQEQ